MATPLSHEIAMRCIESGFAEKSMGRIRAEIKRRRNLVDPVLAEAEYSSADRSPHYWIALPKGVAGDDAATTLERRGVKVSPSHQFHSGHRQDRHYIRASITAYAGDGEIVGAFREIRRYVEVKPRRKVS